MKKIEYNSFDVILRKLVYFFTTLLSVLLASTYLIANEVGYKEVFSFLDEEYDFEEMVRLLKRNSRRYAKRQMTWFNRDEEIKWFHPSQKEQIKAFILSDQDSL